MAISNLSTASTPKTPPLLLTSFQPWLAHQRSNASDDLLLALQDLTTRGALAGQDLARQESGGHTPKLGHCILLRNLPVSLRRVIAHYNPWAIVACGMAEGRSHLTLERHGRLGDQILTTPFPIANRSAILADFQDISSRLFHLCRQPPPSRPPHSPTDAPFKSSPKSSTQLIIPRFFKVS